MKHVFRWYDTFCLMPLFLLGCSSTPPHVLEKTETPSVVKINSIIQAAKLNNSSESLVTLLDPEVTTIEQAFEKAQLAKEEGKIDRVLFYYVKALQFEPKNTQALQEIAAIHEHLNKPEVALKIYQAILKLDKNNLMANENVGLYYLKNRQWDLAYKHLRLVAISDENRWKTQNGLGVLADLNKKYDEAIQYYQKALAQDAENPLILNNMGYSYYLKGDEKTAKQYFNQALSVDSQYQRAIYNLALIEIKQQRYSEALSLLNRDMKLYESYNTIGYLCMLNHQYETAEQYFALAIAESPVYFAAAEENLDALKKRMLQK